MANQSLVRKPFCRAKNRLTRQNAPERIEEAVESMADEGRVSGKKRSLPGRSDGRDNDSLRAPEVCLSILSNFDGSARFSVGRTLVEAGVSGPKLRKTSAALGGPEDALQVAVTCPHKEGFSKGREGSIAEFVRDTVASFTCVGDYPRSVLEVYVNVVSDDGGAVAAALNAVVGAMIDAGINMHATPTACTIAVDDTQCLRVDPTLDEEEAFPCAIAAIAGNSVHALNLLGVVEVGMLKPIEDTAIRTCTALLQLYRHL